MRHLIVFVMVTAGCIPSLPLNDSLQVSCESDADCPVRMSCVEHLERCVIDDGKPPRLLSIEIDYSVGNDPTDSVRHGGVCEVQVVADKALGPETVLTVDCPDQSLTMLAAPDPRNPTVLDFSIPWVCMTATQYVCTVTLGLVDLLGVGGDLVVVTEPVVADCATP